MEYGIFTNIKNQSGLAEISRKYVIRPLLYLNYLTELTVKSVKELYEKSVCLFCT